jgi:hypothetical protein
MVPHIPAPKHYGLHARRVICAAFPRWMFWRGVSASSASHKSPPDRMQSGTGHCDLVAGGGRLDAWASGVTTPLGYYTNLASQLADCLKRCVAYQDRDCDLAEPSPVCAGRLGPRRRCTGWQTCACAACRTGPACRTATPTRRPCPAGLHHCKLNSIFSGCGFRFRAGKRRCCHRCRHAVPR